MPNYCAAFPQPLLDFPTFLSSFSLSLLPFHLPSFPLLKRLFFRPVTFFFFFFSVLSLLVFLLRTVYIPVSFPSLVLQDSLAPPGHGANECWCLQHDAKTIFHTSDTLRLYIRKRLFTEKVVRHYNRLLRVGMARAARIQGVFEQCS